MRRKSPTVEGRVFSKLMMLLQLTHQEAATHLNMSTGNISYWRASGITVQNWTYLVTRALSVMKDNQIVVFTRKGIPIDVMSPRIYCGATGSSLYTLDVGPDGLPKFSVSLFDSDENEEALATVKSWPSIIPVALVELC